MKRLLIILFLFLPFLMKSQDIAPSRSRVKVVLVFDKGNSGKYRLSNDEGYTFVDVKRSKKNAYYSFFYKLPMNDNDSLLINIEIMKRNLWGRFKGDEFTFPYKKNEVILILEFNKKEKGNQKLKNYWVNKMEKITPDSTWDYNQEEKIEFSRPIGCQRFL